MFVDQKNFGLGPLNHEGINCSITSGVVTDIYSNNVYLNASKLKFIPAVKLNRSGRGPPLGRVVFGSRSSSKNGCNNPSIGLSRCSGGYTSNLETKSIASGGVLDRKT